MDLGWARGDGDLGDMERGRAELELRCTGLRRLGDTLRLARLALLGVREPLVMASSMSIA